MKERKKDAPGTRIRELTLTRVFAAPRELVFRAWTDPGHVARWWGPMGFTNPVCDWDARPGGAIRVHMRGPDGVVYPMAGVFHEVVPPERLVFTSTAMEDAEGNPQLEVLNTVTFAEQDGKTTLTVHAVVVKAGPAAAGALGGMEEGWNQSLDKLGAEVAPAAADAPEREFVSTRVFNTPRELVWRALTEAERLKHWWGPKGFTMLACTVDLRPGGLFHYCMQAPSGHQMWGKFVYREIVAPERLVFVSSFSDDKGGATRHPMSATWPLEVLNTLTLEEHDGRTTLTLRGGPINATEAERKTFAGGFESMQRGFAGTWDQLAEYLEA
jgi:uncharacterized protein YndB with AHSA1/START domain